MTSHKRLEDPAALLHGPTSAICVAQSNEMVHVTRPCNASKKSLIAEAGSLFRSGGASYHITGG